MVGSVTTKILSAAVGVVLVWLIGVASFGGLGAQEPLTGQDCEGRHGFGAGDWYSPDGSTCVLVNYFPDESPALGTAVKLWRTENPEQFQHYLEQAAIPVSPETLAAEAEMARLVNELRTSLGLNPLIYDADIAVAARLWSQTMRDTGNFVHNPQYGQQIPAGWRHSGENISWRTFTGSIFEAVGESFQSLSASSSHYDNMVNPVYSHIGVGVALENGAIWITQNFASYP